ncbi:MAG: hypothetical protein WBC44_11700 [Planctomycetaceae bacterium]
MGDEKPTDPDHIGNGPLGTLLLAVGALVCFLATVEGIGGLPFEMPHSWYRDRELWIGAGIAALVAGILIQRPPKGDERDTT